MSSSSSVLIVEDNDDHAELARYHLGRACPVAELTRATTGDEALGFLRQRAGNEESTQFDLVLLDLKLPQMSGLQVLEAIRGDSSIRRVPVVMLSTSNAKNDKSEAYRHSVNGYVVKPTGHEQYKNLFQAIVGFWLEQNQTLGGQT